MQDLKAFYPGAPEPAEFDTKIKGRFDVPLITPVGEICLVKQETIETLENKKTGEFNQLEVKVSRTSVRNATLAYRARLSASEYDKESSLIVLACSDNNIGRANDVINEVFLAYKRDAVEYKNRIAQNTADFIDSRIDLISKELNSVEESYESFMEQNGLINLQMDASAYLAQTTEARKQLLELETELAVTKYLTDYVMENSGNNQPIPVIGGLGTGLASSIAEYNKLTLELVRRAENTSMDGPRMRDISRRLEALYSRA